MAITAIATFNFHCCIFQNCFLARSKMTQLVAAFTVLARPLHSSLSHSPLNSSHGSTSLLAPFSLPSHGSTSTAPLFSFPSRLFSPPLKPSQNLSTLLNPSLPTQLIPSFSSCLLKAPFQSFFALCRLFRSL